MRLFEETENNSCLSGHYEGRKVILVDEKMSNEKMVKEAVEEAKIKAAEAEQNAEAAGETAEDAPVSYTHLGDQPVAKFALCEDDEVEAVYAYCNLHGLWKA